MRLAMIRMLRYVFVGQIQLRLWVKCFYVIKVDGWGEAKEECETGGIQHTNLKQLLPGPYREILTSPPSKGRT